MPGLLVLTIDTTSLPLSPAQENEKPGRLENELELVDEKRAIVFVNTKNKCDMVSRQLDALGHRCTVLHGSKTQVLATFPVQQFWSWVLTLGAHCSPRLCRLSSCLAVLHVCGRPAATWTAVPVQDQREQGLLGFREDKYNILVATDVAGRGIDVSDVALVRPACCAACTGLPESPPCSQTAAAGLRLQLPRQAGWGALQPPSSSLTVCNVTAGCGAGDQLRHAGHDRELHPPHRPHRPCRQEGRCHHLPHLVGLPKAASFPLQTCCG